MGLADDIEQAVPRAFMGHVLKAYYADPAAAGRVTPENFDARMALLRTHIQATTARYGSTAEGGQGEWVGALWNNLLTDISTPGGPLGDRRQALIDFLNDPSLAQTLNDPRNANLIDSETLILASRSGAAGASARDDMRDNMFSLARSIRASGGRLGSAFDAASARSGLLQSGENLQGVINAEIERMRTAPVVTPVVEAVTISPNTSAADVPETTDAPEEAAETGTPPITTTLPSDGARPPESYETEPEEDKNCIEQILEFITGLLGLDDDDEREQTQETPAPAAASATTPETIALSDSLRAVPELTSLIALDTNSNGLEASELSGENLTRALDTIKTALGASNTDFNNDGHTNIEDVRSGVEAINTRLTTTPTR